MFLFLVTLHAARLHGYISTRRRKTKGT